MKYAIIVLATLLAGASTASAMASWKPPAKQCYECKKSK